MKELKIIEETSYSEMGKEMIKTVSSQSRFMISQMSLSINEKTFIFRVQNHSSVEFDRKTESGEIRDTFTMVEIIVSWLRDAHRDLMRFSIGDLVTKDGYIYVITGFDTNTEGRSYVTKVLSITTGHTIKYVDIRTLRYLEDK